MVKQSRLPGIVLGFLIVAIMMACTPPVLPPPITTTVLVPVPAATQAYLVFTNESETASSSGPVSLGASLGSVFGRSLDATTNLPQLPANPQRGTIEPPDQIMQAGNRLSHDFAAGPISNSRSLVPSSPNADSSPTTGAVGTTGTYIVANPNTYTNSSQIGVTLRYKSAVPVAGRTLCIWVADNCWDAGHPANGTASGYTYNSGATEPFLVNTTQVNSLAAKFLSDGTNDIYGLDTKLYGIEWPDSGSAPATGLITPQGEIHIYILDLNPSASGNSKGNGGTMGYFWNLDNFSAALYSGSNQKIMFQLDAENFANPALDGVPSHVSGTSTWNLTGDSYWPNEIVSTLAHEFQHMIHFYQKQVVNNVGPTDTWINEMCSMVTEDFVAYSIGTVGPRGVPYALPLPYSISTFNFGVGTLGNTAVDNDINSRQAVANYYHDSVSLMNWNNSNSLPNYGLAFSFGSWLARNYGGPALFHYIVDSPYTDEMAILFAIASVRGVLRTMPQLVEEWNAAMISGSTAYPTSISGDKYQDASGPFTNYKYGSYNALDYYPFNVATHSYIAQGGPKLANLSSLKVLGPLQFQYLRVMPNSQFTVVLPQNVTVQVVTVP